MGESTHEWAKRQKLSATQSTSAVCEDCGRKWTATLAEVPVTVFIKDLDEYYLKISKNLLEEEEEEPPMVLCVFRPSDRDPWDIGVTLSCVAPRQDSPYQWSINHKHNGPAATSVCQIIPRRADKNVESKGEVSHTESDIVTIKEEIKKEIDEEMVEVMNFDPLIEEIDVKPDINSITASRFASASAADIVKLRQERYEEGTYKNTKWAAKVFKDWYSEKIESGDYSTVVWENLPKEQLNEVLARFYVEARKQNGNTYSKIALTSLRSGLQRYLSDEPWHVQYSLMSDPAFRESNKTMTGIFKWLSRQGLNIVQHHKPIEPQDIDKLKLACVIGMDNPLALQRLVWLSIALHFGRRGLESYCEMTKNTFIVKTDEDGMQYLEHTYCKKNKDEMVDKLGRMYEQPDDEFCPIRAYEKYFSLLNKDVDYLWQRPHKQFLTHGVWYQRYVLGKHMLGNFLKSMCRDAGIRTLYTNHSAHVTTGVLLNDARFGENEKITAILKSYIQNDSQAKKKKMAYTINKDLSNKTNENLLNMSIMADNFQNPQPERNSPSTSLSFEEPLSLQETTTAINFEDSEESSDIENSSDV